MVKVVIIGQDPYHEPRQAQGMSFSVPEDVDIPPSLVNIMREIESDLGEEDASGASGRGERARGYDLKRNPGGYGERAS